MLVRLGQTVRGTGVFKNYRFAQTSSALKPIEYKNEKYSEKPKYPEIVDLSFEARQTRKAESWHKEIEELETVEEKLIKINMPRYYGYKVVSMTDSRFPYNCLPLTQHYTRTLFEEETESDKKADVEDNHKDSFVAALRTEIIDAVEFSYEFFRRKYETNSLEAQDQDRIFGQLVVEQINRVLINTLAADFQHLNEVEVDLNPRHEAFWFVGGIEPPKNVVKSKKGRLWQKEMANDPVDRIVQYTGQPYLALRHRKPLNPIRSVAEYSDGVKAKDLPLYKYDPRTIGYMTSYRHGTNIPGFWPGSPNSFGLLAIEPRDYIVTRNPSFGKEDSQEALHAQAIQSSFAWLLAQANYNGFSTFSDVTYPMNTQTIITNGRDWSFYEYQLNTTLIHSKHVHENPKANYCRGTKELQLFQEIDQNGKCVGFNDNVVRLLLKFYRNPPTTKDLDVAELQPYLGKNYKKIADYQDAEQRIFLENRFKHLASNRSRHLATPETYLWEKFYKIDHNTRPMEARRRFFELNINPWRRTLDQHQLEYIPRKVRPDDKYHNHIKFKKSYYP